MNKILLVDALGLFFKSYYALEKTSLRRIDGFPVFAIYGFFKSLFKSIREINPHQLVIVCDSEGPSFRKEVYSDYKANRKEAPEELKIQLSYLIKLFERIGYPCITRKGYEADDIIATIARHTSFTNQVYILSSDKDLCQLVNQHIFSVHSPMTMSGSFKIMYEKDIIEKFGVNPPQILDYLAIVGDSSDNIPGIAGIGTKGAQELLAQYSDLKDIYDHLDDIKPKLKEKLENGKEKAFLSLELANLAHVSDLKQEEYLVPMNGEIVHQLHKEFEILEFKNMEEINILKTLIKNESLEKPYIMADEKVDSNEKKRIYSCIDTENQVLELIENIKSKKMFVFDTETTSLNIQKAEIIGISISLEEYEAFYIPLYIEKDIFSQGVSIEFFIKHFSPIFADSHIKKIAHNLKYDYKIMLKYLNDLQGLYFDTMIAAYLISPDSKRYNMDDLAKQYLDYDTITYEDIVHIKTQTLKDIDLATVVEYATEDADITYRLYTLFSKKLKELNLESVFFNVEMPLIPILAHMELDGIRINSLYFKDLKETLFKHIELLKDEIYQLAGNEFNINSPKQMMQVLYQDLKIAPKDGWKSKKQSTAEEVLLTMNHEPVIIKILEYRKYFKLYSTYVVPFSLYNSQSTKAEERIHTSFNQTGTATGRLSSSDPNLQNIPIRDRVGKHIREGFIPKKGYQFVGLDYSQIELRILAHYAKDEFLLKAFQKDEDIHLMTASQIFIKEIEEISSKERSIAKTINFGIIYGMGAKKLARELEIPLKEAVQFIDRYFEIFHGVKDFIDQTKNQVREQEYVETLLGRKRFFYNINQSAEYLAIMNERMAVNTIIQGTCADIMKKCMIDIFKVIRGNDHIKLLLQIHDELIFEVLEKEVGYFSEIIKEKMEQVLQLSVSLKISLNIGESWEKLK